MIELSPSSSPEVLPAKHLPERVPTDAALVEALGRLAGWATV